MEEVAKVSRDLHYIKRMIAREWLIFLSSLPIGLIIIPLVVALIAAWPDLMKPLTSHEREVRALIRNSQFQVLPHADQVTKLRQVLIEKNWPGFEVTSKMLLDPNFSNDEAEAIKEFRKAEKEKLPDELYPPPIDEILKQLKKTEDILWAYSQNPYRREIGRIYSKTREEPLFAGPVFMLITYGLLLFVRSVLWAIRAVRKV